MKTLNMDWLKRGRALLPFVLLAELLVAATFGLLAVAPANANPVKLADGRLIVGLESGTDAQEKAELTTLAGVRKVRELPGANAIVVEPSAAVSSEEAISGLREADGVRYVQRNYVHEALGIPSDPLWDELWGMQKIGAPAAWDKISGGPVTVAVIDTGIDTTHQDLAPNLWRNQGEIAGNRVDDDSNGVIDDVNGATFQGSGRVTSGDPTDTDGHGTHVSGTIAGKTGDNYGVVGVNPAAKVLAVSFIGPRGGSSVDAIRSIDYAVRNGAKVINASWGGGPSEPALKEAIARAGNAGVLFVAAAGNDGKDADKLPMYPAAYDLPNIVSVAATTPDDELASFSNYGATSVDIAAPGTGIVSSVPVDDFDSYSGTSMASPHVAGAASLVLAQEPGLSVGALKDRLLKSVDTVSGLQGTSVSGGRLNVARAVGAGNGQPKPPREIKLSGSAQRNGEIKVNVTSSVPASTVRLTYRVRAGATPIGAAPAKQIAVGAETRSVTTKMSSKVLKKVKAQLKKRRAVTVDVRAVGSDANGSIGDPQVITLRISN